MTTARRSFLFAAAFCGLVTACGGGDSPAPAPTPAPAPAPAPPPAGPSPTCTGTEPFSAVADASVAVGKAAGAVIAGCSGPLAEVVWTQTAGPIVDILSYTSQAITFEPASTPGLTYSFRVNFRDAGGVQRSATVSTVATAAPTPALVLARVDQAVRKGGSVSLRAWPTLAAGETNTWTQIAGPQVTMDASDPNRVLFVAPEVTRDTALVFRVTRRTAAGATDSDDVMVLVENHAQAPADPAGTGPYTFSDMHVSRVYPYRANGPFASVLARCTYDANLQYFGAGANACPLATLPYLHQTTGGAVPTVGQIMDRVLVSHDWMGQVFETFLTNQLAGNDDLKRLFNGVTAIVIGAHVRPSFYYALTGAIYLDADNFWLTAAQRDVIDESPDFRSDFDRDLGYSSAWRYTEGGQSIFVNFPADSRIGRDQAYLLAESGWLLYHELAHASDFLPPARRGMLNNALPPWENVAGGTLPSSQLTAVYPLTSNEMRGLAQVKFQGATATAEQRGYTPDTVASFFAPDRATDEYNYSTEREDAAMVFEEFMMFRNHGWRRDMAITDKITATTTSANLIVRWGQRGRVGTPAIKLRAELLVSLMAPWIPASDVQNLPAPLQMRAGESWAANLMLPGPPAGLAAALAARSPLDAAAERATLLRDVSRHHGHGSPNDRFLRRLDR
jgi:hypothetical protein